MALPSYLSFLSAALPDFNASSSATYVPQAIAQSNSFKVTSTKATNITPVPIGTKSTTGTICLNGNCGRERFYHKPSQSRKLYCFACFNLIKANTHKRCFGRNCTNIVREPGQSQGPDANARQSLVLCACCAEEHKKEQQQQHSADADYNDNDNEGKRGASVSWADASEN